MMNYFIVVRIHTDGMKNRECPLCSIINCVVSAEVDEYIWVIFKKHETKVVRIVIMVHSWKVSQGMCSSSR